MVPILVNGELGLSSQGKPKANLLLLGPPGVGKTEGRQAPMEGTYPASGSERAN
jgi:hypothetical protein